VAALEASPALRGIHALSLEGVEVDARAIGDLGRACPSLTSLSVGRSCRFSPTPSPSPSPSTRGTWHRALSALPDLTAAYVWPPGLPPEPEDAAPRGRRFTLRVDRAGYPDDSELPRFSLPCCADAVLQDLFALDVWMHQDDAFRYAT